MRFLKLRNLFRKRKLYKLSADSAVELADNVKFMMDTYGDSVYKPMYFEWFTRHVVMIEKEKPNDK